MLTAFKLECQICGYGEIAKHIALRRRRRDACWLESSYPHHLCGSSLMVKPQPSKLVMWVRFPSIAPDGLWKLFNNYPYKNFDKVSGG